MSDRAELQHQTPARQSVLARNYDRAARFYGISAGIYSLNQIARSKAHQIRFIQPGDRVIYLGVGSGEDAETAAARGADVTCVDISAGMLSATRRRLAARQLTAELICSSALELDHYDRYDVCCANYFLNMFRPGDMLTMMKHAVRLVRPGGRFMIADVALPQGNPLYRSFNRIYRKLAMVSFWTLGLVPLHRDYDYASHFGDLRLAIEETRYFRLFPRGPVVYQCLVGRKAP
jgi:demethylmenaquinone methyltransferase/2-methoxy-6-polyprenyl-1,4-benzoquinol methylase